MRSALGRRPARPDGDRPAPARRTRPRRVLRQCAGRQRDGLTALWPLLTRATATAAASRASWSRSISAAAASVEDPPPACCAALLHLVRCRRARHRPPAERQATGKPRVGRVLVAALRGRPACASRLPTTAAVSIAPRSPPPPAAWRAGRAEIVLQSGLSTRAEADTLAGRGVPRCRRLRRPQVGGQIAIESRDVGLHRAARDPRPDRSPRARGRRQATPRPTPIASQRTRRTRHEEHNDHKNTNSLLVFLWSFVFWRPLSW